MPSEFEPRRIKEAGEILKKQLHMVEKGFDQTDKSHKIIEGNRSLLKRLLIFFRGFLSNR